jgi:hypothetical protein
MLFWKDRLDGAQFAVELPKLLAANIWTSIMIILAALVRIHAVNAFEA